MTIPTIKEPDDLSEHFWGIVECCYFCGFKTKFWHENTNNPICTECAKNHKVEDLPDHGKLIRARKRKARMESKNA